MVKRYRQLTARQGACWFEVHYELTTDAAQSNEAIKSYAVLTIVTKATG